MILLMYARLLTFSGHSCTRVCNSIFFWCCPSFYNKWQIAFFYNVPCNNNKFDIKTTCFILIFLSHFPQH